MSTQVQIDKKLRFIEDELSILKAMVLKLSQHRAPIKALKLEGVLKGLSVADEDVEAAKKSLFKSDAA